MPYRDFFDGAALGAYWTPAHSGVGSHTVSGGLLNMAVSGDGRARIQATAGELWPVGFRYEVELDTGTPPFGTVAGLVIRLPAASLHPFVYWDGFGDRPVAAFINNSNDWSNINLGANQSLTRYLGIVRNADDSLQFQFSNDGTAWSNIGAAIAAGGNWTAEQLQGLVKPEVLYYKNAAGTQAFRSFNQAYVAPVPVANQLRFISVPDPILAGTAYTLQVEAWDSVLGLRDTAFVGSVTIGIDVAVPVGFIIASGTLTRTAVAGVATFPSIVFAGTGVVEPPPIVPLVPGPGSGGPPPSGGLLRFYAELEKQNRARKVRVKKEEQRVIVESEAFANEADSLLSDVEGLLSQVRDPNAIRPDLFTRLFPRGR